MALDKQKIYLFEEHSSTLPVWWAERDTPQTVVYLDAHLDLQRTAESSITALQSCTTLDEVRALESPSHLNPSTRYAFGIENFLYPAHRLGLIERLVWVAPPHIPRQYSPSLIEYMQQMDGITFDELIGFDSVGCNTLRGSLLGLDITICDYDQLDALGLNTPYYLDIDIDYFIEVPADRIWLDPAEVIDKVVDQLGEPSLVTISRAVNSGFTPLAFRYVGDYVHSQLSANRADFDYYRRLNAAVEKLMAGRIEEGRAICAQLTEMRPELAAAYYIEGLSTAECADKQELLASASRLDSQYEFDLARDVMGLLHRKKPRKPRQMEMLKKALDNIDPSSREGAFAELVVAHLLSLDGDSAAALELLGRQTGDYADHEEVLLAIAAGQLGKSEKRAQTRELLEKVSHGTKNATVANLYLGDLDAAQQNYQAALARYSVAHENAPAWMLPLERMHICYQALEMHDRQAQVRREIERRMRLLEQVVNGRRGAAPIGQASPTIGQTSPK